MVQTPRCNKISTNLNFKFWYFIDKFYFNWRFCRIIFFFFWTIFLIDVLIEGLFKKALINMQGGPWWMKFCIENFPIAGWWILATWVLIPKFFCLKLIISKPKCWFLGLSFIFHSISIFIFIFDTVWHQHMCMMYSKKSNAYPMNLKWFIHYRMNNLLCENITFTTTHPWCHSGFQIH